MNRTTSILLALLLACCARAQFGALPVVQVQSRWTPTKLGPVAWYAAEDNALDSAGINDAVWTGTAGYTNAVIARGFFFNGSSWLNTGTTMPQAGGLFAGADRQWTLAAWFLTPSNAVHHVATRAVETSIFRTFHIFLAGASSRAATPTLNIRGAVNSTALNLDDGAWHHLVATWDGTAAKLYADGGFRTNLTVGVATEDTTTTLQFGARTGGLSISAAGTATDDVLVFGRALTETEVKRLYDESTLQRDRGQPWRTPTLWTPLKLGSKLAVWFDGSDASTLLDVDSNVATNGAYVQTWNDKSGNGRHATAPASAQRPRWFSGIQNGRAVVRTDGDDLLNIGSGGGVFRNKTAGYIFLVAKDADQAGGDAQHAFIFTSTANSGSVRLDVRGRSFAGAIWTALGRRLDGDTYVMVAASGAAGHRIIRAFADWGGGNIRISLDGGAYASTAYSSGAGASEDTDGAVSLMFRATTTSECPADSEIAEVVIVNEAMTDAEVTALENYLKTKWGTP